MLTWKIESLCSGSHQQRNHQVQQNLTCLQQQHFFQQSARILRWKDEMGTNAKITQNNGHTTCPYRHVLGSISRITNFPCTNPSQSQKTHHFRIHTCLTRFPQTEKHPEHTSWQTSPRINKNTHLIRTYHQWFWGNIKNEKTNIRTQPKIHLIYHRKYQCHSSPLSKSYPLGSLPSTFDKNRFQLRVQTLPVSRLL